MKKMMIKAGTALLSGAALVSPAFAAVETTAITTAISDAGAAGAVVGSAVIVMIVGIKVFKWIRRAL